MGRVYIAVFYRYSAKENLVSIDFCCIIKEIVISRGIQYFWYMFFCGIFLCYMDRRVSIFDNVILTIDETGRTYFYDSKGSLISSEDNAK